MYREGKKEVQETAVIGGANRSRSDRANAPEKVKKKERQMSGPGL